MLLLLHSVAILRPAALRGPHICIRMQTDPPPPELDERQSAFMKAQGFAWNAKTRSWVKGNLASMQRLECRSSTRVLSWVGDQTDLPTDMLATIRTANTRFEAALRDAREEAIGQKDVDRKIAFEIKDRIAKPQAPFVWLGLQMAICAFLVLHTPLPQIWPSGDTERGLFVPAAVGVAFAPLLSALRRERWVRQPGIEDSEGEIERLLVDATLGSYALPAPWDWRASDRQWSVAVLAAESLAGLNSGLFWHAGVQAGVIGYANPLFAGAGDIGGLIASMLAILAVALANVGRVAYFFDSAVDGIPAEIAAARKASARAESYYAMTASSPEAAGLAVRTTKALADAWSTKFERGTGTFTTQLTLAFVSSAACCLAWELSGRSVAAPVLAASVAAFDTYVLRPDPQLTRTTIDLEEFVARQAGAARK